MASAAADTSKATAAWLAVCGAEEMAHRKATRRRTGRVPLSDEELIQRLQDEAPEALAATIPDAKFNAAVKGLLNEASFTEERLHFYCRKCGKYHLKSHGHYRLRQ